MRARDARRLALCGVAAGLIGVIGLSVGTTDGTVGEILLAARNTNVSAGGDVGEAGPPIVVTPDDDRTGDKTAKRVPAPGGTKTPLPAEPAPDRGGGVIGGAGGPQVVTATSAVSKADEKVAVATCPTGTRIYSGGGKIKPVERGEGATGGLMLNVLRPVADPNGLDSFVATANRRFVEDQALARFNWSLEAFAVCGPELPGYEHVAAKNVDSDQRVTSTVACPTGKRVIGAGGGIGDQFGMFSFDQLGPDSDGTSVTVTGVDDITDGVRPGLRAVLAVAVCAFPPEGYEVSRPASATGQDDATLRTATASCPDDKRIYGTGFSKRDDAGHAVVTSLSLNPRSSASPAGMRVASPDSQRPADQGIVLAATAICAD